MNSKREIREDCYKDMLEDSITGVESVLNHLQKIENNVTIFGEDIIAKDRLRSSYDLELALASMCILLRKMAENLFIIMPEEIRRDVNSVIHSNKFEYVDKDILLVYSQKGKEEVSMGHLLQFAKSILLH